jgi:hypothetical protein
MLGPYPECGDYEMVFGPWPKAPTTDTLQGLIAQYSCGINSRRGSPESRAQEYLLRFQYEEEQAETKRKVEYDAMMRDHISPLHSSSLAASRWRQDLARAPGMLTSILGFSRGEGHCRSLHCAPSEASVGMTRVGRCFLEFCHWDGHDDTAKGAAHPSLNCL